MILLKTAGNISRRFCVNKKLNIYYHDFTKGHTAPQTNTCGGIRVRFSPDLKFRKGCADLRFHSAFPGKQCLFHSSSSLFTDIMTQTVEKSYQLFVKLGVFFIQQPVELSSTGRCAAFSLDCAAVYAMMDSLL